MLLFFFSVLTTFGSSTTADLAFWDSSRLPTIRLNCSLLEWTSLLRDYDANPATELYRYCESFKYEFHTENTVLKSVGLRVKGSASERIRPEIGASLTHNSSALIRSQFTVKFDATFKDDESVYGSADIPQILSNKDRTFYGNSKMALSNGDDDASLIKNVLVSDIRNDFKTRATRFAFARLYITIGTEPERYWGVYQLEETIDEEFMKKRDISTKRGFLYKCSSVDSQQAKFQMRHATPDASLFIGEELIDPPSARAWQNKSFKAFYPVYDIKDGDVLMGRTKLAEFIYYINISLSQKPPLAEIRSKFKISNILKGLAVDAFVLDEDSTWFEGNNYYLFTKDDEWDIFRYDYDASFPSRATTDLSLTDSAPLYSICPLQGPGNYTLKLNTTSLTFTLKPVKTIPLSSSAQRLASVSTQPSLIGVNGTNVSLTRTADGLWTARFNMSECYHVRLNNKMMGLSPFSGLLSTPFMKFNRADYNTPFLSHPVIDLLLSYPELRQEYLGYLFELNSLLTPTSVMARVRKYLDLIREASSPALLQVQSSLPFNENVTEISRILEARRRTLQISHPNFKAPSRV